MSKLSRESEPTFLLETDPDFKVVYGPGRNLIDEHFVGALQRSRKRRDVCSAASDTLEISSAVNINVFEVAPNINHFNLKHIWDWQHREHKDVKGWTERNCQCENTGDCFEQVFMEKEPAVLIITLNRKWEKRSRSTGQIFKGNDGREISIPEKLDFMRSGPYALRGVVTYIPHGDDSGHYVSTAWLGRDPRSKQDLYGEFNDAAKVVPQVWSDANSKKLATGSRVLMCVREGHWNTEASRKQGHERTPWTRSNASEEIVRRYIDVPEEAISSSDSSSGSD